MIDPMRAAVNLLVEKINKPGVMSLAGQLSEKRCAKAMAAYFRLIGTEVKQAHLERLAVSATSKETGRAAAEHRVKQIVRRKTHLLNEVLEDQIERAFLLAAKQNHMHEADGDEDLTVGDTSGQLSQDAADYAAKKAAQSVVGINATTVKLIADTVAQAVGLQMSPADLSRDLRDLLDGMTKWRADAIARTEMSDAFGEAAIQRLNRNEIEYKQLILSPGACPICESIADNGPVPIDEPFVDDDGEEYDRSPIHTNCRCATVGAHGPEDEE